MSEDTALVSVESPLVSVDTALVSVDTALVSENTALVSVESALVSVDTALVSVDTALVWAVRSVARGDTTGAVFGRGLGHYDRCRGLDSAQLHVLFKLVDFLFVALRQFPVVLVRLPSCFSMVVDVPVVLMQQVVRCPW